MESLRWLLDGYPQDWLTSVTVIRDGGKDPFGVELPDVEYTIDRCLVGFGSSEDSAEWEDQPEDRASIFVERGQFDFQQNDLIIVPDGPWASGRWQIDGRPQTGPLGTECRLRRRI